MARLHRAFWNDSSLFSKSSWLRGAAWKEGKEKESWEASQAYAASSWSETMNKIKNNIDVTNGAVKWDPLVIDIVNASLASASWTKYLRLQSGQPFTLVHGDLHPANCLWVPSSRRLVFLDFENVGIGSGPQDCAQFLISHMNPMMSNDDPQNKTWPPVPEGVKNITMFVMGDDENGAPGNYWTTLEEMPVSTPTSYYLNPNGVLSTVPSSGTSSLSYIYDPANPVPTIGGNNLLIKCGPLDQRPIEQAKRQDVLIFTTPVLTEPVALAGLLQATVFFSTNVTDTDVVVKLIDVYPTSDPKDPLLAGESVLVADGIARARWRNFPSSNDPAPLSGNPADVYEVNLSLWSTAYVFAAGHSIRVHVSSSNYPRFFPNSNTGTPMNATQGINNITAYTTIFLGSPQGNSHVTLPVVDLANLPGFPVEDTVTSMLSRYEDSWNANVRNREDGDVDLKTWLTRRLSQAWAAMTTGA